jgi:hypothetical protein
VLASAFFLFTLCMKHARGAHEYKRRNLNDDSSERTTRFTYDTDNCGDLNDDYDTSSEYEASSPYSPPRQSSRKMTPTRLTAVTPPPPPYTDESRL